MMFIDLLVLFLVLTTIDAQNECLNGDCINIRNCPQIISILSSRPHSAEMLQTLRNLQCGFEGSNPKVCCNQTMTTTTTTTEVPDLENPPNPPDVTNHPNLRLLDHLRCGPILRAYQPEIIDGNKSRIFENPWMALIAYDIGRPNPEFRCGGSVISSRYVLTAAHCVTSLPEGLRLIGVRVGDHDISKERDCVINSKGQEILCAEKYQDFGVENVHFHPEYTRTKLQNDIALIRVNDTIDFRPHNVKPICLPFGTATALTQKKAAIAGWNLELVTPNQDLRQIKVKLITNKKCKEIYKQMTQREIWYKQLCGQMLNVDCLGDSGGPLLAAGIYNGRSVRGIQYGVISEGLIQCNEGFPEVYTRVAYYMDWILDTIKT